MKKFAFIFGMLFAGIAAVLSIVIFQLGSMNLGLDNHGATANFLFGVWMLLAAPAITFMRAVGIPEGDWRAYVIAVAINAALGFFIGAIIGVIIKMWKKRANTNDTAA